MEGRPKDISAITQVAEKSHFIPEGWAKIMTLREVRNLVIPKEELQYKYYELQMSVQDIAVE